MPSRTRGSRYARGPPPERAEEAVGAVVGDGHRAELEVVAERSHHLGEHLAVQAVQERRQVVADEPEVLGDRRVVLEDDGAAAGDAAHLAQPLRAVGPVVVGEDGHRGVDRVVGERQRLGTWR